MENKLLQYHTFYDYSDVEIQFTIKTKKINLDVLTNILEISPREGWSYGEFYEGKHFNTETRQVEAITRQRPNTLWVLNSKSFTDSNRFEKHAEKLLGLLAKKQSIIQTFIEQKDDFEIITTIYLTFDNKEKHFGFGATSEYFRRFSNISHYVQWQTK